MTASPNSARPRVPSRASTIAVRSVAVALVCGLALGLVGCIAVTPMAMRINEDGTTDFVSCVAFEQIVSVEAESYLREENSDSQRALEGIEFPANLEPGEVFTARSVPEGEWDSLTLTIHSDEDYSLPGRFDREYMTVGEWTWTRAGIFVGTVPVKGCPINE